MIRYLIQDALFLPMRIVVPPGFRCSPALPAGPSAGARRASPLVLRLRAGCPGHCRLVPGLLPGAGALPRVLCRQPGGGPRPRPGAVPRLRGRERGTPAPCPPPRTGESRSRLPHRAVRRLPCAGAPPGRSAPWLPESLVTLWAEQHPAVPRQLQFPLRPAGSGREGKP